jgi:hypothetical protein
VILPCIDGDATKAEELDDGVLNARISYYLAASEIIRQVLKKWKYSNSLFSVENFLHPVLPGLHLVSILLERNGTNRGTNLQVEKTR